MADIDKDLKRKQKALPGVKGKDSSSIPVDEAVAAVDVPGAATGGEEQGRKRDSGRRPGPRRREIEPSEFFEKVLAIKRVTKVTKGGKKIAFSALVVVGNEHGKVGFAIEKAGEVASAIKKSLGKAKKSMVIIPLKGTTIPHEIIGRCGAAQVLLKPAGDGTGVIASGAIRAVCDGAGIRNILTKCHRSNNPLNVVKATFDGLLRLKKFTNQTNDSPQEQALEVSAVSGADSKE